MFRLLPNVISGSGDGWEGILTSFIVFLGDVCFDTFGELIRLVDYGFPKYFNGLTVTTVNAGFLKLGAGLLKWRDVVVGLVNFGGCDGRVVYELIFLLMCWDWRVCDWRVGGCRVWDSRVWDFFMMDELYFGGWSKNLGFSLMTIGLEIGLDDIWGKGLL